MILGVVLVAAVAAGVLSASQAKVYTAQASTKAQSVSQNAGFAGLVQSSTQLPSETSAQLAQRATRPDVLREVKATLKSPQSLAQIRSQLSVSQDQQSNFVVMSAHAPTASRAASLANVAASALADVSNRQVQQQFTRIAAAQNKAAESLSSKFAGKKFLKLTPDEQTQYLSNARQAATLEGVAAKLEAFSKVVTVASVTTSATEPSSPSSPHPLSSIILGAALGLVIGLLLSWILESIDRRLRRPDETESVYGLPVLGAVGQGALGRVPGADPEAAPLASFKLLRTNLRFLTRDFAPPRVVLVTSALAEEGKSTGCDRSGARGCRQRRSHAARRGRPLSAGARPAPRPLVRTRALRIPVFFCLTRGRRPGARPECCLGQNAGQRLGNGDHGEAGVHYCRGDVLDPGQSLRRRGVRRDDRRGQAGL